MARRDVLLGITQAETTKPDRQATAGYATRGASRSMLSSIGELAAQAAKAERLLEGETVVDLDPSLIDGSFVSDRMEDDDEAFAELAAAIRERGQDSPILVRPHPDEERALSDRIRSPSCSRGKTTWETRPRRRQGAS